MGTEKPTKTSVASATSSHSECAHIGSDEDTEASAQSPGKPAKKKKYKYTRQLVRIAQDDGMTQTEIAKLCRVNHQSIVSKWMSGESRGTEQQLAPLIKRYGSRLNRTTARVYRAIDAPAQRWEDTQFGQQLLSLAEAAKVSDADRVATSTESLLELIRRHWQALLPQLDVYPRESHLKVLIAAFQVHFASLLPTQVVQVEGPIIFRYSFCRLEGRVDRRGVDVARNPVSRWLLHDGQCGKFILVRQYRLAILPSERQRLASEQAHREEELSRLWQETGSVGRKPPLILPDWIESVDDAARWVSRIEPAKTVEELLEFTDGYVESENQIHDLHDEQTLPFLLRKALVEHGYQVPGVEKISG